MAYQVLARKWRPKNFTEMAGQQHVLKGLLHAIEQGRLHHAYLFTGTRGVGKTTISRIIAKCLNCETGVTPNPCGKCDACTAIDAGRFVDLIEIDAASRTKVEDTREILDNVQYAPTQGRFKIYLIDEVHMLSTHSFNALLKTLEEPPEHVKFLLATTDPQKLPVTILSRCLQFHLRHLPVDVISERLKEILDHEKITYEASALNLLAQAAHGSMRDGLSLLDQAIAFGQNNVTAAVVREMLGSVEEARLYAIIDALIAQDAQVLFDHIAEFAQYTDQYGEALKAIAKILHAIAIIQQIPNYQAEGLDQDKLAQWAGQIEPHQIQLLYQIAITAGRDLPLAPDLKTGFEMALLRLLAFRPMAMPEIKSTPKAQTQNATVQPHNHHSHQHNTARTAVASTTTQNKAMPSSLEAFKAQLAAKQQNADIKKKPIAAQPRLEADTKTTPAAEQTAISPSNTTAEKPGQVEQQATQRVISASHWGDVIQALGLSGMALQFANNTSFVAQEDQKITLNVDPQFAAMQSKMLVPLTQALSDYCGQKIELKLDVSQSAELATTPAKQKAQTQAATQQAAESAIEQDTHVQYLKSHFGAVIAPGSIQPNE